jgi:hypothetical protein
VPASSASSSSSSSEEPPPLTDQEQILRLANELGGAAALQGLLAGNTARNPHHDVHRQHAPDDQPAPAKAIEQQQAVVNAAGVEFGEDGFEWDVDSVELAWAASTPVDDPPKGSGEAGIETRLALSLAGHTFDYWDARVCDDPQQEARSDDNVLLELFWGGELKHVESQAVFKAAVVDLLESVVGISPVALTFPVREGGCMYALLAVPVELRVADALSLAQLLFRDFGSVPDKAQERRTAGDDEPAPGGCAQQ